MEDIQVVSSGVARSGKEARVLLRCILALFLRRNKALVRGI
jgi:hypothetical protein